MKKQFKIGDIVEVACDDHGRFELGEKIRLVGWDGQHFIAARADDELGVTWFIGAERIKKGRMVARRTLATHDASYHLSAVSG